MYTSFRAHEQHLVSVSLLRDIKSNVISERAKYLP